MSIARGFRRGAGSARIHRFWRTPLRRGSITLAFGLALVMALPLSSLGSSLPLGGPLGGVLKVIHQATGGVQRVVHTVTQGGQAPAPQRAASGSGASGGAGSHAAGSSSSPTRPGMYGTNPHGQGTVASVGLNQSTNLPYAYLPGGNPGETVVGRGRSEKTAKGYHAHTTILSLLGAEILGVDANPGQSHTGPLNAVQTGILNNICTASGSLACLSVLAADTAATSRGASTRFSLAHATVAGAHGIDVGVAESRSSISQTGTCQSASGSSQAAGVNIAGGPLASVAKSSDSSSACSGKSPSQTASSSVIGLGGAGVPLPQPGCANGTPNTTLSILGLVDTVCNAYDKTQASSPAGVREALTAIVLPASGSSLIKTVAASAESHAVAPKQGGGGGGHHGGGGGHHHHGGGGGKGGHRHHHGGHRSGGGSGHHCTDADRDCGKGPVGTGTCTGDSADRDGDCVFPGGGSETGFVSGESTQSGSDTGSGAAGAGDANGSGPLPFTGQDLLGLMLVGLLMAGGGLAIAMRTRVGND